MNRAFLHSFLSYNNGTLTATQTGRERQTGDLSAVSYGLGHFMFHAPKQTRVCRVLTSFQDTRNDPQTFTVVHSVHFGLMFSFIPNAQHPPQKLYFLFCTNCTYCIKKRV